MLSQKGPSTPFSRIKHTFSILYHKFLSEQTKHKGERIITILAVASYIIHLILIQLVNHEIISAGQYDYLFKNSISAIYTPFSFILLYEVYLLVYYLPKSITTYVGKQYEIITLIIIRRIFKDISNLELGSDWFENTYDLQLTYDILATLILFFLIFIFNFLNKRSYVEEQDIDKLRSEVKRFIQQKKIIATCLVPIFIGLAIYSFSDWLYVSFFSFTDMVRSIRDINEIFFNEFFTLLILTDVLLLLLSLLQTERFETIIRNSGFIISTILIRTSFGVTGFTNTLLIVSAVLFSVIILVIHNQFRRFSEAPNN